MMDGLSPSADYIAAIRRMEEALSNLRNTAAISSFLVENTLSEISSGTATLTSDETDLIVFSTYNTEKLAKALWNEWSALNSMGIKMRRPAA